jgi:hypothetical protein
VLVSWGGVVSVVVVEVEVEEEEEEEEEATGVQCVKSEALEAGSSRGLGAVAWFSR